MGQNWAPPRDLSGVAEAEEPTDAVVIRRSHDDPEVFAVLFRRHAAVLLRYLGRRIGPEAAEDVLADTFLEAFRQRHRYDSTRPDARPWLYGIATNRMGRFRRTELRQLRATERSGVDPVLEAFAERSDARVSASATGRQLAAALARLPRGHRDALLLFAWAELTYEEVAAAIGVPVGTVRSRISRARGTLRKALGGVNPMTVEEGEPNG
ncbi:RNA polymerase sigma factor [Plantactinospora sp. KLBMP9567]|uniref:RNA polymerase sigma factor n=1 Tax=Plantactinospora sp. KLBMP9567 TaxID=3085900 RepID=UPI002980D121|nr:RNA polymerase sigma factor [Plantactinospora sp. KLBMP9567]MDW5323016.1 RNA polymerase sigma factor [Plantactinospora sp. KLBMP9567]